MKLFGFGIAAHDPRDRFTDFSLRTICERDYLRIPAPHALVMRAHTLFDLRERVLYVARVLPVCKVLAYLFIGKVTPEPGAVPCQERDYDEKRRDDYKRQRRAASRRLRVCYDRGFRVMPAPFHHTILNLAQEIVDKA